MTSPSTVHAEHVEAFVAGVEEALSVIGGKWKLLILAHLACGTRRYGELRRLIPTITEKMLIQQLRELEADGLVRRTYYLTIPPKVEYSLTEYDRSIRDALESLFAWGTAHLVQKEKLKDPVG